MSLTRTNLVCAATVCAFALTHLGCMSPWAAPPAQGQTSTQTTVVSERAHQYPPEVSPSNDANVDSNLAGVLDKLQQVRAIDPAAEEKLIAELRQTPAASWPLVAEQFRASLAYREQLAAKNRRAQQNAEPAPAVSPPSAPIGALVDPRNADADHVLSSVLAQSMHRPMQAPLESGASPAEFVSDRSAYPMAVSSAPPTGDLLGDHPPTAEQATFESASKPVRDITNELRTNQSPAPSAPPAEADWQQLVEKAAEDLSRHVAPSPATTADVHQHVSLRILRLLAGDSERALEPIPHISPGEQDYWSRQIFALATYLDHHSQPDDKRRAAATVTHLDEAVSHLRELGSLSLRNLSFCKNVYGYGAIEPYEDDRFAPGDEVSLYVEVENYHSQSTEKGFCTLLGSSYELLDEQGERVGGGEFPDVDDCCRSRRRDFHIQYGLALPTKLAPGQYRLQLVVKDRQSDKIGHASIAFAIRNNRQ